MKPIFNKVAITVIALNCFVSSSCKKSDNAPPTAPTGTTYTINGTTYTATTQVAAHNDSSVQQGVFPALSTTSGYISYTLTQDTLYQYLFAQENVSSAGDTTKLVILMSSPNGLSTGLYSIIGGPLTTITSNVSNFATISYYDSKNNFSDSAMVGKNIGAFSINAINSSSSGGGTLSGVFNFIVTNKKGNVPTTDTITGGQLFNIPFQQF